MYHFTLACTAAAAQPCCTCSSHISEDVQLLFITSHWLVLQQLLNHAAPAVVIFLEMFHCSLLLHTGLYCISCSTMQHLQMFSCCVYHFLLAWTMGAAPTCSTCRCRSDISEAFVYHCIFVCTADAGPQCSTCSNHISADVYLMCTTSHWLVLQQLLNHAAPAVVIFLQMFICCLPLHTGLYCTSCSTMQHMQYLHVIFLQMFSWCVPLYTGLYGSSCSTMQHLQ